MAITSVDDIETIAVVGSGQMGRGIAAVAALSGYETYLNDIDEEQLEEAMQEIEWSYQKTVEHGNATEEEVDAALDRLNSTLSLEEAAGDADFVTEAAVEQQAVKQDIFADLDEVCPERTILSTNTSGLNITKLAESVDRPSQVVGTHWFNPPMLMDLVEVILTEHTDPDVADTAEDLVESFGKTPIRCKKDIPSFIVNRCMRPYGEAAAWLAYWDEVTYEEVDSAFKYREGFPMGPFELADFTGGIQIRVEGEQDHLEDDRPMSYDTHVCPLLKELYEEGRMGRKADAGYYDYSDKDQPEISEEAGEDFDVMLVWAPTINEAAKMVENDVASVEDIDVGMELGGNWPVGPLQKADEVGLETVVEKLVEIAEMHVEHDSEFNKVAEVLPTDLLIEMAKNDETFY